MNLSAFFSKVWAHTADVVFPRTCLVCGAPAQERGGDSFECLCPACARQVEFFKPPFCARCGHAVPLEREGCAHCRIEEPFYARARTFGPMAGTVRLLVHALKYRGALYAAQDMARLAAGAPGYLDFLKGAVLVPVPLHPKKRRARGFNQSEIFARALAGRAQCFGVENLLKRVKDTPTQTRLDAGERRRNMRGAFALNSPKAHLDLARRCVLVDDVLTTGSTLNSAAETLARAGFRQIDILSFAHG